MAVQLSKMKWAVIILAIFMIFGFYIVNDSHLRSQIFEIEESFEKVNRSYQESFCQFQDITESGAWCMDFQNVDRWHMILDEHVSKGIEELVGYSSVADFGAGFGQYGRFLLRKVPHTTALESPKVKKFYDTLIKKMQNVGVYGKPPVIRSWEGYDGGTKIEILTENFVKHVDLSRPFDLKKKFDWIMSLEVGEHIPRKYEGAFIDNIVRHCEKGIIISWAIPKQGGRSHVNCRPNEYIIEKMKERGLIHDVKSQEFMRKKASVGYFKTNIMVFRKE